MTYLRKIVQVVQMEVYMEEGKKVDTGIGYKNGKYRPSVFFKKEYQKDIEDHFKNKGYDTFNKYINDLVLRDVGITPAGNMEKE